MGQASAGAVAKDGGQSNLNNGKYLLLCKKSSQTPKEVPMYGTFSSWHLPRRIVAKVNAGLKSKPKRKLDLSRIVIR